MLQVFLANILCFMDMICKKIIDFTNQLRFLPLTILVSIIILPLDNLIAEYVNIKTDKTELEIAAYCKRIQKLKELAHKNQDHDSYRHYCNEQSRIVEIFQTNGITNISLSGKIYPLNK